MLFLLQPDDLALLRLDDLDELRDRAREVVEPRRGGSLERGGREAVPAEGPREAVELLGRNGGGSLGGARCGRLRLGTGALQRESEAMSACHSCAYSPRRAERTRDAVVSS